jgi:hypothetical protein
MPERWDEPENMNALDDTPVFYTKSYVVDGQNNTVTFEPYAYSYVAKNAFAAYNEEEDVKVTVKDLNFAGEHFGVFAGVHGQLRDNFVTDFVNVKIINNGNYLYNHTKTVEVPLTSFAASGTTTIDGCEITGSYWVGKDKDKNQYAETAMTKFNGVYDVFVANSGQYKGGDMLNRKYTTVTNDSEIGRIFVQSHGNLIVEDSKVTEIAAIPLVYGTITIKAGTNVTSMNITQLSSYAPNIKIESGATVGELNFIYDEGKTLNKTKVKIEGTVNKITANGVEITL